MSSTQTDRRGIKGIETRSIDWIPHSERHGIVWHQGPFWFTGGFILTSLLAGYIGPSLGLGVIWSLLAVVGGMAFGTVFMALHANQGPRLGLPQMIQSRAQFGSRGAMFPMAVAVMIYIGYNVFQFVMAGQALNLPLKVGDGRFWYVVCAAVALIIAVVGHDLLHTFQRWTSYAVVALFAIFTIVAAVHLPQSHHHAPSAFIFAAFLAQFAAAGGYQISYAIYVSDYSRYLPADVPDGKMIGWTFLGATFGAAWMGCLGVLMASYMPTAGPVAAVHTTADALFPGFGTIIVLACLPALIGTSAVNSYGAMLTSATIIDGLRSVSPGKRLRIAGVLTVSLVALALSLLLPANFMGTFTTFINIMVYCLVPWTAVNLTDFYLVRKGHYSISDIVDSTGRYGRWSWRGLTAYFLGFLVMIPFMSLSFYSGPVMKAIGGADISPFVGLIVSAVSYLVIARRYGTAVVREEAVSPVPAMALD